MQSATTRPNIDQAQQVCISCKAQKRRCNKALPRCSYCTRRNWSCKYHPSDEIRTSTLASEHVWDIVPVPNEIADIQSLDFPSMLFLDPNLLQHGQIEIPRPTPPVPAHVLQLLGDLNQVHITADKFFEFTHAWMPFISKKRFYDIHLKPSYQSRPDVVLLFLSLKLITTLPPTSPRNPRTSLYHAVKHYYLEVEGSSTFSIPVLQAGILLALYELGHAIYPAAYLSIGACARYAHALGINGSGTMVTTRVTTLVEVEERRRVWWVIVIIDRFVNIGCPGRPFATSRPTLDDLLPADDAEWDQGMVRTDDSSTLLSPMSTHMSKFSLLCQAARLLDQVLCYMSCDDGKDDDRWMQLERTLQSMLTVSMSRHEYALATFHTITETITANLVQKRCFVDRDPESTSPWGLYCVYRICASFLRDENEPESKAMMAKLKESFYTVDRRWNAAGVYLQLLEAREVMKG
ncbi:putative fungal-specific transcription factor [Pleomassaria siparia CBS 279.74]|uniref:Putative fungal-specific transcription factor n=1 Tax=Pleomassaria siparia CBS 279.74 TaxID=1314801 RepID=A0A6G1JWR6_9PLEO|nr:putative fungal-specific transcription factor [Pleomassaria siparia CBS 279.74]